MGSDAGALAGVLGAGTEAEMLQILPTADVARVRACRGFETRGVLYSAYDMDSEKGRATLLELRHSIFSLRRFRALAAQEILDFPRCAHAWASMQVLDSSRRGMECALGVC